MDKRLIELEVENFRSLRKVALLLGSLNVLVGPNGAGKTANAPSSSSRRTRLPSPTG
jgi:ABC-type uncharacterized transport system ATPase subunit